MFNVVRLSALIKHTLRQQAAGSASGSANASAAASAAASGAASTNTTTSNNVKRILSLIRLAMMVSVGQPLLLKNCFVSSKCLISIILPSF